MELSGSWYKLRVYIRGHDHFNGRQSSPLSINDASYHWTTLITNSYPETWELGSIVLKTRRVSSVTVNNVLCVRSGCPQMHPESQQRACKRWFDYSGIYVEAQADVDNAVRRICEIEVTPIDANATLVFECQAVFPDNSKLSRQCSNKI